VGNTSSEEHHPMNKTDFGPESFKAKLLLFVRTNYFNIKKLFVLHTQFIHVILTTKQPICLSSTNWLSSKMVKKCAECEIETELLCVT
jgi:hypothetical protein